MDILTASNQALASRFGARVCKDPGDGCWLWTGTIGDDGYGMIQLSNPRRTRRAHIVAWEMENGPVPDGHVLHHTCRVRACVRPSHLLVLLPGEHSLLANNPFTENSRKTMCPLGHPLEGENLTDYRGWRGCRLCNSLKSLVNRDRRRLDKLESRGLAIKPGLVTFVRVYRNMPGSGSRNKTHAAEELVRTGLDSTDLSVGWDRRSLTLCGVLFDYGRIASAGTSHAAEWREPQHDSPEWAVSCGQCLKSINLRAAMLPAGAGE